MAKELTMENSSEFEEMGFEEGEAEAEPEVKADSEAEAKAETETETEAETKVEPEPEQEVKAEAEAEAETGEKEQKLAEKRERYGPKPDDWDGSEKSYFRFRDLQGELTKKSMAYRDLETKYAQMDFEIEKMKKLKGAAEFEALSKSDEQELKEEDPAAYAEYLEQKYANASVQSEIQSREQSLITRRFVTNALVAVNDLKEQLGWNVQINPSLPLEAQPQVIEFLRKSPGFVKVDQFLARQDCPWQPEDGGAYSAKQIADAYFLLNREEVLAKHRVTSAEQLKQNISQARNGGSVFDKTRKVDSTQPTHKKYDSMTQKDFEEMSADEVERAEKDLLKTQ